MEGDAHLVGLAVAEVHQQFLGAGKHVRRLPA
jgi:hypothetical protein